MLLRAFLRYRDRDRTRRANERQGKPPADRKGRNNAALCALYIYCWKNGDEWTQMRMTTLMKKAERKGWIPPLTKRGDMP